MNPFPMTLALALGIGISANTLADDSVTLHSETRWKQATARAEGVAVSQHGLTLQQAPTGHWTSEWFEASESASWKSVAVETEIDLFANKTIEVVVDGSAKPFVDADGVEHDWYGRCMIAILDARRWVMAIRSGINHIQWGRRDAIHVLTSRDEGRSWSKLNHWFDDTPVQGLPYEDGHTHSEPGLYRMPNGDLILQFWRTSFTSGTKQLRSTDDGKTWQLDHDRIEVQDVPDVPGNLAIGTEDWFIDPENPEHVYMAFQYWDYRGKLGNHLSGTFLARSTDNGKSFRFLSWIGPLGDTRDRGSRATFEPAIEYVGYRTIVAVLRDAEPGASGGGYTWQTVSTDMGASFAPLVDISEQVDGGIANGLWQRVRLYKESNPIFQFGNQLDYAQAEGRLWGFGLHSNGGGYTRKPVVYYSDDNGKTWHGPESLHGAMHPGTDTGYGDLKRRTDGTFVAATYFATRDSSVADTEQYTFGGQRARLLVEVDRDADGQADADSGWREIYGGRNEIGLSQISGVRWRVQLELRAPQGTRVPVVRSLQLQTEPKAGVTVSAAGPRRPKVFLDWQMQPPLERDGERTLPDAGPAGRDARLLGDVRYAADPPRFELDGRAALVAPEAIEPDRLTVEVVFRADRVDGDLQHIVSVFDPWDDRAPYNPRQWTLEIHEGRLRFGIYGHDQRWHLVSSNLPLPRGWHHAVGTFDGRQVRLYLNGSLQRRFDSDPNGQFKGYINRPRPGAAKPPSAGSSAPLGHYGFEGAITRVRLLDQALAADEIREAYRTACELVPAIVEQGRLVGPSQPKTPQPD
jgi:hypothetical protein